MFYFVTAVGCFCCPRSRRRDYNITNGAGCQHYFSSFLVFFESFCFSTKNPSVYAGFRHFIFTIKYHILQNFIVFSAFSLCFYQHFSDAYCIYNSIFFISLLPEKHFPLPPQYFLLLPKAKNCRSSPGSFFFYSFYLLSIRSL